MITADRHGALESGVYSPYDCTNYLQLQLFFSLENEQRGHKIKNTLILKREIMFELFKVLRRF